MELAIPDSCFETTDGQGALLLAATLRRRDDELRQRDDAHQEAEALRWKEVSARQQAAFWKTQRVGRETALRRRARNWSAQRLR